MTKKITGDSAIDACKEIMGIEIFTSISKNVKTNSYQVGFNTLRLLIRSIITSHQVDDTAETDISKRVKEHLEQKDSSLDVIGNSNTAEKPEQDEWVEWMLAHPTKLPPDTPDNTENAKELAKFLPETKDLDKLLDRESCPNCDTPDNTEKLKEFARWVIEFNCRSHWDDDLIKEKAEESGLINEDWSFTDILEEK